MPHWVSVWGQAHTVIEYLSARYGDRTALVTVRTNLGGEQIRLRVSNQEGKKSLQITGAAVSTLEGETVRVLFAGREVLVLAPGAEAYSDAVTLPVRPGDHICVRLAFTGPAASGNSIGTNVLYSIKGDFTAGGPFDTELPGQSAGFCGLDQAVPALSAIEVLAPDDAGAIVCFGDSITQMGLWTAPLAKELLRRRPGRFSVINKGIGGNRLLRGAASVTYGRAGVERFERDVLGEAGAAAVIFAIGTNDIGMAHDPGEPDWTGAERLAEALAVLARRARERGLTVYGSTLLPCMVYSGYLAIQEAERVKLNDWMRGLEGGLFDKVLDFEAAVRDVRRPERMNMAFDSGDHLHPGPLGGSRMAQCALQALL